MISLGWALICYDQYSYKKRKFEDGRVREKTMGRHTEKIAAHKPRGAWGYQKLKERYGGFPGGSVAKSLPTNAEGRSSIPGLGGSHMLRSSEAREPHLWASALEPGSCSYWSLHAQSPCSASRGAIAMRSPCPATGEQSLPATAREKACAAVAAQHSQKEMAIRRKRPWRRESHSPREETNPTDCLSLDFLPPDLWDNTFLFISHPVYGTSYGCPRKLIHWHFDLCSLHD